MANHFERKIIDAIAQNIPLEAIHTLIIDLLQHCSIHRFKLVWLTELREEVLWIEREYSFDFNTKKIFFCYQDKDIALLYFQSTDELLDNNFSSLINYCYLRFRRETTIPHHKNINRDLALAAKMQQFLVPQNLYCNRSFCASGLYIPNYQVGGDFYDVVPINDYKIGFCIGDISGKGVNAAILMSYFIGFIRSTLLMNLALEDVVRIINQKIYELTQGEKFITLFLAIYNTQDRRLVYINSGHIPIPLYDQNHLEWLETGTTILGAFKELPFMELGKKIIDTPQNLFLYTDGLLNLNIDHEPFLSKKELAYLLQNECKEKTPFEITEYFAHKTKTISVEEELKDDISVLALTLD